MQTQLMKYSRIEETKVFAGRLNSIAESSDFDSRSKGHFVTYESVQCIPLHTILLALNISRVDLFSLDVESKFFLRGD